MDFVVAPGTGCFPALTQPFWNRFVSNAVKGKIVRLAFFLFILPIAAHAADKITSAEAALDHFRTACDNEIKQSVSPETMATINGRRQGPSLVIVRRPARDFVNLKDPKVLAEASHRDLYGSHGSLLKATGDIWVLNYNSMKELEVYLDAASGSVLCIAYIPEG